MWLLNIISFYIEVTSRRRRRCDVLIDGKVKVFNAGAAFDRYVVIYYYIFLNINILYVP